MIRECTMRNGKWAKKENRIAAMKQIEHELNIDMPEKWYKVTTKDYQITGMRKVIDGSQMTHFQLVKEYLPNYDWKEWLFSKTPNGMWSMRSVRVRYMTWVAQKLGIANEQDWYDVGREHLAEFDAGGMLRIAYNGSLYAAVKDCFPEHEWHEWLFRKVPNGFWDDRNNRLRYMNWLGEKLCFKSDEDWYTLTFRDVVDGCGKGMLAKFGNSIVKAVIDHMPKVNWEVSRFAKSGKFQKRLYSHMRLLFPNNEIIWEYRDKRLKHCSGLPIRFDIFVPDFNLAVEYNGIQHYESIKGWGGEEVLDKIKKRDQHRREECAKFGIRLIEVPHTWDGNIDSVKKML
jgi:hypothetical protein